MGVIYRLHVESFGSDLVIELNDITVVRQAGNLSCNMTTTISEWLTIGVNNIRINRRFTNESFYNDESLLVVYVFEIDSEDPYGINKKLISQIQAPEYIEGVAPATEFEVAFNIFSLPIIPAFYRGVIVEPNKQNFERLLSHYKRIISLLVSKNLDEFFQYALNKEVEYAKLYYQKLEDRIAENKAILSLEYEDEQNQIFEVDDFNLQIGIYNFGRLVCLEDKFENNPCIFFYNTLLGGATYIPLYFYQPEKNDDFILIR